MFLFFLFVFFIYSVDLPRSMQLQNDISKKSEWYASLTNYLGSWLLIGHLDVDVSNGLPPSGPGCSKTSNGQVATEIHGFARTICALEEKRKEESVSRRFRHHFDVVSAYDVEDKKRKELAKIGRKLSMGFF